MLSIGGAAPVAGDQELAAGAHGRFDRLCDFAYKMQKRGDLGGGLQGRERPVEKAGDKSVVVRLCSHGQSLFHGARKLTSIGASKRTFSRKSTSAGHFHAARPSEGGDPAVA